MFCEIKFVIITYRSAFIARTRVIADGLFKSRRIRAINGFSFGVLLLSIIPIAFGGAHDGGGGVDSSFGIFVLIWVLSSLSAKIVAQK